MGNELKIDGNAKKQNDQKSSVSTCSYADFI